MPDALSPGCPAFIIALIPHDLERPVGRACTKESLPMSHRNVPGREQCLAASKPLLEAAERPTFRPCAQKSLDRA